MVRFSFAPSLVLSLILVVASAAQTAWGPRNPRNVPPGRYLHVLVYDPVRQCTLMFGGHPGLSQPPLGDTWKWDGTDWTQLHPATSPPPRFGAMACFDEVRGRVVMFGGADGFQLLGDTWEWTGTDWQRLFANGPARYSAGLAFDPTSRRPLLVGGGNRGIALGDTWQLTPTGWQQLNPPIVPPATIAPACCADPVRSEIVFDGGSTNVGTWVWDGMTWTRAPASRPHYQRSTAAYDALRRRVVAFEDQETWEWTGNAWLRRWPGLVPPQSVRDHAALAFDAARQRVVMFGGVDNAAAYDDTWEYHLFAPSAYESFGQGCVGTTGQSPLLDPHDGTLPWIGETWTMDLTRLPPSQVNVPFGVLGMSRTQWLGIPLPLDLGFAGAPGCPLLTSADTSLTPLTNTGGRATWAIPLPLDLRTLGVSFYLQAAVLDYGANALNVVVSNGGAAVPGMK